MLIQVQNICWLPNLLTEKRLYLILNYIIKLKAMNNQKSREDLSPKIKIALDKAIQKIIAEEKARNGYLVVSDSNGNIKRIPAKDL